MAFRGQDLWRRAPIFKWGFTDVLPGFREAAGLFTVYIAAEFAYDKMNGSGHHHGAAAHHGAAEGHGHEASHASSGAGKPAAAGHH
jgi:hypothetical protein